MPRPREFDEADALDAAVQCFWSHGYEATSIRTLAECMGVATGSLYNAFGDKRALYERALERYVTGTTRARITRLQAQVPARRAISALFEEIIERALADSERRGCMLINAAVELGSQDAKMQRSVAAELGVIEAFFRDRIEAGQQDGSINAGQSADDLARHLLSVLVGVRVLTRVRPDRALLQGAVAPALSLLDPRSATSASDTETRQDDRPLLLADAERPQGHDVSRGNGARLSDNSGGHQRR